MSKNSSFGNGHVLRAFDIIDATLDGTGKYSTPYVDVSKFKSFNTVLFNNNASLTVTYRFSINSSNDMDKRIDISVPTTTSIYLQELGTQNILAKYLCVQLAGTPSQTANFQLVFYEAPTGLQNDLSNIGAGSQVLKEPDEMRTLISSNASVNITQGTNEIDFTVAGGQNVTLSNAGLAPSESLVNDGIGPSLATKGLLAGPGINLISDSNQVEIINTYGTSPYQGTTSITPVEANTNAIICGAGNTNNAANGLIGAVTSTISSTSPRSVILGGEINTCTGDFDQTIIGSCESLISECKRSGIYSAELCSIDTTANSGLNSIWGGRNNTITNTTLNTSFNQMVGCLNATNTNSNQTIMLNASGSITDSSNCTIISQGTITGSSNSHIIGNGNITHNDVFICSDTSSGPIPSIATNQCLMRFSNGYTLYTNSTTTTGITVGAGGSSWSSVCDKNRKNILSELDYVDILNRLDSIPVYKYYYKGNPENQINFGPVAQEYHEQFTNINEKKDKLVIESMDIISLLMAGLKGLNEIVKDQEKEINDTKQLSKNILIKNTDNETAIENNIKSIIDKVEDNNDKFEYHVRESINDNLNVLKTIEHIENENEQQVNNIINFVKDNKYEMNKRIEELDEKIDVLIRKFEQKEVNSTNIKLERRIHDLEKRLKFLEIQH